METLNNPKPIQEITNVLPSIKEKIEKTINEMNNYLEFLKDEKFIELPNETEDDAIRRAESIYDRLDEIVQRRKLVMKNGKETIELIDNVKNRINKVIESCGKDEIHLAKANNELIDKIFKLEERKMNREIDNLQQQINLIKQRFVNKKNEWDNQRICIGELRIRKEEIQQIEEWTGMQMGNIIFDSNVDNWKKETSVFDQLILNKSNLIFLIEDERGNKFGGYVNAKIDKTKKAIKDPKSFVFSLKSNGRLNGMLKFENSDPQNAFYLNSESGDCLFLFGDDGDGGYDICICKENNKTQSYCVQKSFNYKGIQNPLCGKTYPDKFIPTRIKVIQLN